MYNQVIAFLDYIFHYIRTQQVIINFNIELTTMKWFDKVGWVQMKFFEFIKGKLNKKYFNQSKYRGQQDRAS